MVRLWLPSYSHCRFVPISHSAHPCFIFEAVPRAEGDMALPAFAFHSLSISPCAPFVIASKMSKNGQTRNRCAPRVMVEPVLSFHRGETKLKTTG